MDWTSEPDEEDIRREREKARELRRSNWWQNRIAAGLCHYCGAKVGARELTLDFSWDRSAAEYLKLYGKIKEARRG